VFRWRQARRVEFRLVTKRLSQHLRTLAQVRGDVELEVKGAVTQRSVLGALEARYPMLRDTIRGQVTGHRRSFLRFSACEEDLSHQPPDAPLPDAVASGRNPLSSWAHCRRLAWLGFTDLGYCWNRREYHRHQGVDLLDRII
jgi:molybdopterin synthase sulfur carrier subunit